MDASSSSYNHRYEVFLSFRGEDTRKNFTSHLLAALKDNRFNVFHDTMLERGQSVSSELLRAIEGSKLSIVVFSKNYADSKWCLDELVKIMDCRRRSSHPQTVLPVFYDVEPTDVKNQTGEYAAAFANHTNDHEIQKVKNWKAALKEVGELSGLHLRNDSNGDESDLVRKIVKQVGDKLDEPYLNVAYYPVGIESQVQELEDLLCLRTDDIRIVTICGLAGIGKTTIAKALFNKNRRLFDGSCFLADVRATAARPDGLITLQQTLIADILKQNVPKIYSCDRGIEVIRQRLWSQKVLIVLDDVDHIVQLKNLATNKQWLQQGSRVIITTRNRSCVGSLDVKFYEPKPLDASNSLKLFCWHAFGEEYPKEGYNLLSWDVVDYAQGLPLVLDTLGSYMKPFDNIEEWQEALERLRTIPHDDVQGKLKLSFDSLGPKDQELFLDIACFFVGMNKDVMFHVLEEEAPGYYPKYEFKVLCDRCLVKVDWYGRLWMHEMVRDMGREIVRQESLNDPGRRSRLWHSQDALRLLKQSLGTKKVESIILELDDTNKEQLQIDVMTFAKMSKLRMIRFRNINLHGTYNSCLHFFGKLKLLMWHGFPLTCIPSNLELRNLVSLGLQNSKLKQLWQGMRVLNKLRYLDVSNSHLLTNTPDLSGVTNLEKLWLYNCTNLVAIHHSIGCLEKLVLLDLENCISLTNVPFDILQLAYLEDINLSGCSKLFKATRFEVSFSSLWRLLSSTFLGRLQPTSLQSNLLGSMQGGSSLKQLKLQYCNLSYLPIAIGSFVSLEGLDLSGNRFSNLPASIKNLSRLCFISLEDCVGLMSIPDLPNDVRVISVKNCSSLETIQAPSRQSNGKMHVMCEYNIKLLENILAYKEHARFGLSFVFMEKEEVPRWFNNSEGIEYRLKEPQLDGLLNQERNDCSLKIVWGAGPGKTTLYEALIKDVRATTSSPATRPATRPDELITLGEINNGSVPINLNRPYEQKLWCEKVLIVLDGVNHIVHLKKLPIEKSSFELLKDLLKKKRLRFLIPENATVIPEPLLSGSVGNVQVPGDEQRVNP